MAAFDSIDGWFDEGFRISQSRKAAKGYSSSRDKRRTSSSGSPSPRGGMSTSGGSGVKKANIKSVLSKAPEVMVKITGSSKGLNSAKNHIDYISRNGKIDLVDETGEQHAGTLGAYFHLEFVAV